MGAPDAFIGAESKRQALFAGINLSIVTAPEITLALSNPPLVMSEILAVPKAVDFSVRNQPVVRVKLLLLNEIVSVISSGPARVTLLLIIRLAIVLPTNILAGII